MGEVTAIILPEGVYANGTIYTVIPGSYALAGNTLERRLRKVLALDKDLGSIIRSIATEHKEKRLTIFTLGSKIKYVGHTWKQVLVVETSQMMRGHL